MNLKAVLWDMDGTLINSEPLYEEAMHQTNHKYDLKLNTDIDTTGISLPDVWAFIAAIKSSKPSYQEWARDIDQYVATNMMQLPVFEHALNILNKANALNLRQACVSNNNKGYIKQIITFNKIDHLFDHYLGCEDFVNCKPHPEPYLQSVQRLGLQPEQCMAVEDSAVGVMSAKTAGLKVALFCPPHLQPPTQQADYIVKCHSELLNLIN